MSNQNGLTAVEETITPAKAKILLNNNKRNRPINERNLQTLVNAIKQDNFHITGESIKVAKNGDLVDGQHRLMAVIKSGMPIKSFVVRGVDNDAFKYLDTGKKRNAADVLGIEGYKNPGRIAAVAMFVINFKRGSYLKAANRNKGQGRSIISNADVSGFVFKNKDGLEESIPFGHNKENKLLTGNTLAAFHFIFKGINGGDADDFCWKVAIGDGAKDTPIFFLRQRLIGDLRSTKKMSRIEKMALICKAWNLFRQNKKVSVLKWESLREAFPKPI